MRKLMCKPIAEEIMEEVKTIPNKKKLCIISVGHDPASAAYMRGKMKDAEKCEIPCEHIQIEDSDNAWGELNKTIDQKNLQEDVGGIMLQLPLPERFTKRDVEYFTNLIDSRKDVDGFKENSPFLPCTPEGILYLLKRKFGDLAGKHILLVGKGKLIGKPLINILLNEGCTLTVASSKSDLEEVLTPWYDGVVVAVGKANLINLEWVGAEIVIDAGINFDENGKMCGDCYGYDEINNNYMDVTPVPGGVGPMTRAMLMKHMGEVSKEN